MLGEWRLMGFGWVGVFGFGEVGPSGYEGTLAYFAVYFELF